MTFKKLIQQILEKVDDLDQEVLIFEDGWGSNCTSVKEVGTVPELYNECSGRMPAYILLERPMAE